MGKERGFVPIDEVNAEKIKFAIDLPPYLDRTNIRVNHDRLQGLMDLGGIDHLFVESFEGDRVSAYPTTVGHDSQGGGYAGKVGSSTNEPDIDSNISQNRESCSPTMDMTIRIDTKQISEKNAANLRSHAGWGKEIDLPIRKGLRQTGNKTLLLHNIKHDSAQLAIHSVFQILNNADNFDLYRTISMYGFAGFFIALVQKASDSKSSSAKHRFSFFLGPQLDRAAILNSSTLLQKVVKGVDG